jgi:acetolactate synthase-1/2/3 large subunit
MSLSGADALCRALHESGIACAFGLPGSQNTRLFEALGGSPIRVVVPTHELAGVFMAIGYWRASGRPAAVVTIPGPGFAYTLAGLAEARQDSAAVVQVTGGPATGPRAFQLQALDQRALALPVVKAVIGVEAPAEIAQAARRAVRLAAEGEPGPVLLEHTAHALGEGGSALLDRPSAPSPPPDHAAIQAAALALASARRPLIMAGQGCFGARERLRALAEALPAPVFTTLSGRGVLPEDHPLALAFEFVRGDVSELNALIEQCDAVLALGCKLTAAGTADFALRLPAGRLIHVDASADVLGATYPARIAVAAAAEVFLEAAGAARSGRPAAAAWTAVEVAAWRRRLQAAPAAADPEPRVDGPRPRTARAFFAALQGALPRDAIVVTDSGLHQTLARRHLVVRGPGGLIAPSDFQSMGFGLAAAIGAKLAAPARAVVAIVGDGGFAMSGLELLTAVRERVPLVVVVFNDGQLNRIRLQQLAQFGRASGCALRNPDFALLAASCGAAYARPGADIAAAVRGALGHPVPTVIEVAVGDSPAIHATRAKGVARRLARGLRSLPRVTSGGTGR